MKLDDMGRAKRVTVEQGEHHIVEGEGKKADIQGALPDPSVKLKRRTSDYDREKLQERLGETRGRRAVVNVGAATEPR